MGSEMCIRDRLPAVPYVGPELQIMDHFLTPVPGPWAVPTGTPEEQEEKWWELWGAFEFFRLLSARPELWSARFTAGLQDMLAPRERLSLPGQAERVVWVTSDATLDLTGAIDWTHRVCARRNVKDDMAKIKSRIAGATQDVIISVAELLSFVSFAGARAQSWSGQLILYAGDNMNVTSWLKRGEQGTSWPGRCYEYSDSCRRHTISRSYRSTCAPITTRPPT